MAMANEPLTDKDLVKMTLGEIPPAHRNGNGLSSVVRQLAGELHRTRKRLKMPADDGQETSWAARFFGVYRQEDDEDSPPLALFPTRKAAEAFMSFIDDREDYFVARTDLRAVFWDGPEGEDPKEV